MTYADKNKIVLKRLAGYLLPVILTFLFLYLAFVNVDLKKSINLITNASVLWLSVYILVFFISHYIRALRWKIMVKPVKADASIFNLFGAVMIGYGVNCVIPRLGEVYRGLFIGRWEGISRSTMFGTVIIERIIDTGSFALASLISVFLFPGNLFAEILWLKTSLIIGFASILFISVFIVIIVKFEQKFTVTIVNFIARFNKNLSEKLSGVFSTLISGFSSIRGFASIFKVVIYTSFILLLYALNSYVGFFMLDMQNYGEINFAMAWVFMTISAYGVVIPTPGGTGSYHIISIFVLTNLYGFEYELSAAYALLTHFISYFVFIGSTIGSIYLINRIREKKGISRENFYSVFNIYPDQK